MKINKIFITSFATLAIFSSISFYDSSNVSANGSTKHKVESILKHVWTTKLKKYKHPLDVSRDTTVHKYAYYHAFGIGGKYIPTRTGNFYFSKNKRVLMGVSNDQNGYGKFKYTKLSKNYYMVSSLGVAYSGDNLQHKYVAGYTLFIKMHGNKKMTLSQKYTGTGKTYEYNYNRPHTYYRRLS